MEGFMMKILGMPKMVLILEPFSLDMDVSLNKTNRDQKRLE